QLPVQGEALAFQRKHINLAGVGVIDQGQGALVDLLAPQGALALIDDPDPRQIDVLALKRKSLSLHWELMFTRSLYQTPDMAEQGRILERVAELASAGRVRSTLQHCPGPITAAQLRRAHGWIESGAAMGKLVLEGWG
ncbi:MAG: zinc-binding dehydrogenase, partial [Vulcanococcus sp.]